MVSEEIGGVGVLSIDGVKNKMARVLEVVFYGCGGRKRWFIMDLCGGICWLWCRRRWVGWERCRSMVLETRWAKVPEVVEEGGCGLLWICVEGFVGYGVEGDRWGGIAVDR
ncbi:hypothetical protein Adt_16234 [Abeliophyllum distichum]|uniref:Transmembrane protein n=1 Tax=Abeliophyllum distichum TaxID=126358 RepID=A0ABD1TD39_9LAMI